jgi:hypothetical protein
LGHTWDIILLNLLQAFAWPNLLLIWIKKEIREVHEFQADALVDATKEEYAHLLLSSVFHTASLPMLHMFLDHPVKRRLAMLVKTASRRAKLGTMVTATIVIVAGILGTVSLQGCKQKQESVIISQVVDMDSKTFKQKMDSFSYVKICVQQKCKPRLPVILQKPAQKKMTGAEERALEKTVMQWNLARGIVKELKARDAKSVIQLAALLDRPDITKVMQRYSFLVSTIEYKEEKKTPENDEVKAFVIEKDEARQTLISMLESYKMELEGSFPKDVDVTIQDN